MARMPDLEIFAREFGLKIVTIKDLIDFRMQHESLIRRAATATIPTQYGGSFKLIVYESDVDEMKHVALVKGDLTTPEPVLVRVHDQCLTGDAFGSLRCDCGVQLQFAMQKIEEEGRGVVLYMAQEGRGIGLVDKLRSYVLQDQGYDTVDANLKLGHKADEREYGIGAQILAGLGIRRMRLMTNNPRKIHGLHAFGLEIVERIPIHVGENKFNVHYLRTKGERMGHLP